MLIVWLAVVACASVSFGQDAFGKWFDGRTLRVDCLRRGCGTTDSVWVKRLMDRGSEWHGSRTHLVEPFVGGDYRVVLRDARTGKELYTRGYSNLFREYRDTPEGKTRVAVMEETLLLPMPRRRATVVLQKLDAQQRYVDQCVMPVDPARVEASPYLACAAPLELHGSREKKIDVAIVAQGYAAADSAALQADYARMLGILFGKEPFASHREDFNVYGLSAHVGVDYNTFGADRYAMTFRLHDLHDSLGTTPADYIIIMLGNKQYGGGAIYNFYAVSSMHSMAEYVLPHELGHGIGGLADEYVDEELSYSDLHRTAYEPIEPNITNLVDFGSKWASLLPEGTPVPTPDRDVPRGECGPLGVYEGAGYSSHGVYRPTMHCMMRDYAPFCPVCANRLEEVFRLYTE